MERRACSPSPHVLANCFRKRGCSTDGQKGAQRPPGALPQSQEAEGSAEDPEISLHLREGEFPVSHHTFPREGRKHSLQRFLLV